MKAPASCQQWKSAPYNHSAATLFSQELIPEPSDDEDIVYKGRKHLKHNGGTAHTTKTVSDATGDDWFLPGAEDPVPTTEQAKTEPEPEDDPSAFLSDNFEDDDFFFGPPLDLVTRARAIEDAYNQRLFEPPLKAPAEATPTRRERRTEDKEKGDSRVTDCASRDEKPESPLDMTIFAWLNQTEIPMVTGAARSISQVKHINQKKRTERPDTKSQRETNSTVLGLLTHPGKPKANRKKKRSQQQKRKSQGPTRPLPPIPVSGISQSATSSTAGTEPTTTQANTLNTKITCPPTPPGSFASPICRERSSKCETIVNSAADPRRRPRPRSPASSGRRSPVTLITCDVDQVMIADSLDVPPTARKSVSKYSGPIFEGRGPFWAAWHKDTETHRDDYPKHRPAKSLSRDDAVEELDRANKRIWELEIAVSRSAWKLEFANDQLRNFDEANNKINRLEHTIRRLQAEKTCTMDHLDLSGQEIRRLKARREWDAWQLGFAQQRIGELEGGMRSSVYQRKRKWESPSLCRSKRSKVNSADYLSRRKTWQERKDKFWAEMARQ